MKYTKTRTDTLTITDESESGTDTLSVSHSPPQSSAITFRLVSKANTITLDDDAQRVLFDWLALRVPTKTGDGQR